MHRSDPTMLLGSVGFLEPERSLCSGRNTKPVRSTTIEYSAVCPGARSYPRAFQRLSLDGNSEHVQLDDSTLNADGDCSSAYAHYEVHGARTELVAKPGATELNQPGTSNSSP